MKKEKDFCLSVSGAGVHLSASRRFKMFDYVRKSLGNPDAFVMLRSPGNTDMKVKRVFIGQFIPPTLERL